MRPRRLALIVLAMAAAGLAGARPAAGQSPDAARTPRPQQAAAMILLDGSGSMWAKLGKDTKAYMMRDHIKRALEQPRSLRLGLASFGHRRAGDCTDAEVVVPLDKPDVARFAPFLDKFNPKGKGPVGAGLKAAMEGLGEGEGKRTLIVVADNADNCRVDVCAQARELKQSSPTLTAHVIALGVPKEEQAALACIASTTGGRMFRAETAQEAAAALEETLKLASLAAAPAVVAAPMPAPPPPQPEPAKGAPGLRLTAYLKSGGEPLGAGLRWRVLSAKPDARGPEPAVLYEGDDPLPSLDLKPGRYFVEARFGMAATEATVEVGQTGPTRTDLVLNAGVIRVKEPQARGAAMADRAFYTLHAGASQAGERPRALALSSEAAPIYNVPAGTYLLSVQHGLARLERSVSVPAGAVVDVDMPLYLGELKLSATATEGGPPLERVFFMILEDDPEQPDGLREVARSGSSRPEFTLPASSYHVIVRHEEAEARERITVSPGARLAKTIVVGSGRLTLSARLAGKTTAKLDPEMLSYRVERIAAGRSSASEEVARTVQPEPVLGLSAGRYRVEARYGTANARAVRDVEIKAGGQQTLALELDAGMTSLKIGAGASAVETMSVTWQVLDAGGRTIATTGVAQPRLALAAGRYTARADLKGRTVERAFQVAVGDDITVEIDAR